MSTQQPACTTSHAPRNLPPADWALKLRAGKVGLAPLQELILATLTQHRLMTTQQLHEVLAADVRREFVRRQLSRLQAAEMIASTPVQGRRNDKAWWATPAGRARVTSALRPRRYVMSGERAETHLQRHTLLTNQIGIEFVTWARRAGHDCGPLDWDLEIGHRIRDGELEAIGTMVVSDLRVRLTLHDPDQGDVALIRLVECDRGTETIHNLVDKVRNYSRMLTYIPAEARRTGDTVPLWRRNYSAFPKVMMVFGDREPGWMRRRARQLVDLCRADPLINQYLPDLGLLCTTMDQLASSGPFQPIFWNHVGQQVDIRDAPAAGIVRGRPA